MRVGRHCGRTFRARRTRNVCGRQKKKKRRKKTVRRRSRVYIARTPPPLVIILCVRRPQPKRVVCAREFRRAFETELVFPAITLRVKIYARPCSRGGGGPFVANSCRFTRRRQRNPPRSRHRFSSGAFAKRTAAINYQPYESPVIPTGFQTVSHHVVSLKCFDGFQIIRDEKTDHVHSGLWARGPLARNPRPDGGSK